MADRVRKKVYKHITPTEAFRAVYVDFEGFAEKPPSLIGIVCEYEFYQVVLSEELRPAADYKGLRAQTVSEIGRELITRCQSENRLIVGYSQAELQEFECYGGLELGLLYRDARMIGRRWINRLHPGDVTEWRLKTLLEYIGYAASPHLGDGVVTTRLRSVLTGLARTQGDYARLTPTQKRKWTNLLQYNRIDCLGMRDLVMRASAEMSVGTA
jgi:hypothetical protein